MALKAKLLIHERVEVSRFIARNEHWIEGEEQWPDLSSLLPCAVVSVAAPRCGGGGATRLTHVENVLWGCYGQDSEWKPVCDTLWSRGFAWSAHLNT